ncbi:MAG TPA: hypothetical protein VGP93_03825, partial [Polyangiaceae bacterium]|nr:hypothetical protein [Polyangiaceae bacterium]
MRVAKTRRLRFGFALVFAALFAASVASADESIPEEAKLYFQNGVDLIQASPPNYEDGYYQFKLAYEKSHSWKVLGNLGLCALKLERDGEALQYYTEYLKSGGSDIDPDERAALERDMMIINGNAGAVNLTSSVPNAALKDARAGSTAPPQQYTFEGETLKLRVRAGSHTFVVTAPDGNSLSWEVVLEPGKTAEHRFDFPS